MRRTVSCLALLSAVAVSALPAQQANQRVVCGYEITATRCFPLVPFAKFTLNTTAGATTAALGDMTGAGVVSVTYSAVGAANLTTRTAVQIVGDAANLGLGVGDSWLVEITNTSGGTTTLVAGAGVTITGTATMATNTVRFFIVTITSVTAVTFQSVAVGTIS